MRIFTICILFFATVAGIGVAGKPDPKPQGLVITQYIANEDPNFAPYFIQSDGLGGYKNVNGDASVLMGNGLNGIQFGDRLLDLLVTARTVAVTFSPANAVLPGDPGYVVPANPPVWGTIYNSVRFMNKCTGKYLSMLEMKADNKMTCPMHLHLDPLDGTKNYYRLDMGASDEPETQEVQISCNSADSVGCKDWFIDPIPVVNPDGSTSPGKTRARLNYFTYVHNQSTASNKGAFYMTFHIRATRP